ncbi:MAG: B-box zinc finger protein [Deltaproteobacteria bacterium]|nr:B-box zinc finger protein [Deltaproteobacteria bacterium]
MIPGAQPQPAAARCFIHPDREASARCLACGSTFCKECVTEHKGRVLCAACISGGAGAAGRKRVRAVLALGIQAVGGLAVAWMFFHYLGLALASLPSSWHLAP